MEPDRKCIRRTYFGGTEEVNLDEFISDVVQDEEVGIEEAQRIRDAAPGGVESNTDQHPRYYEVVVRHRCRGAAPPARRGRGRRGVTIWTAVRRSR